MVSAILFIRNEEEKELMKAPYLGGNLLLHTIMELKKIASLKDIYIVGVNSEVPGAIRKDCINEIVKDLNPEGKTLLVSPLYPEINCDDYERLIKRETGAILACDGVVLDNFMIANKYLPDYEHITYELVDIKHKKVKKFTLADAKVSKQENLDDVIVFSLTSSVDLTNEVCRYLNINSGKIDVKHFADGETLVEIGESVRGKRVYVIQSTCKPVNENLMELLICIDALKRSSAAEINCIIPYFGYARQDRKASPRQPISAKLTAKLLEAAGANRLVTFDLHAAQIQGFFECPVDDLTTVQMMGQYFRRKKFDPEEVVVVSPDHGGVKRARTLAEMLGCNIAIIDKRRPKANVCEAMNIIGDVLDKDVIIMDDICDTGGSLIAASDILKKNGCKDVYVGITHALLSNDAASKIENSSIKELVVTNTINVEKEKREATDKITVLSIGWMLSKLILAVSCHTPVSEVYALYN